MIRALSVPETRASLVRSLRNCGGVTSRAIPDDQHGTRPTSDWRLRGFEDPSAERRPKLVQTNWAGNS